MKNEFTEQRPAAPSHLLTIRPSVTEPRRHRGGAAQGTSAGSHFDAQPARACTAAPPHRHTRPGAEASAPLTSPLLWAGQGPSAAGTGRGPTAAPARRWSPGRAAATAAPGAAAPPFRRARALPHRRKPTGLGPPPRSSPRARARPAPPPTGAAAKPHPRPQPPGASGGDPRPRHGEGGARPTNQRAASSRGAGRGLEWQLAR